MQTVSVVAPGFNETAVPPELFKRLSGAVATRVMDCEIGLCCFVHFPLWFEKYFSHGNYKAR